jgi:hypothetical protein
MRMRSFSFLAVLAVGLLTVGTARADVFITAVTNNAANGNGPIQTWTLDLTTGTAVQAGSFVPTGASTIPGANGRGIAVTNTQFYYTELSNGFGATPSIESGLFNGGAGSADNGSVANPTPGLGVQNLHFGAGGLYAVAGYPTTGPLVYVFNPANGVIIQAPVLIATAAGTDGFTILANGNYLMNRGDAVNSYDQYDPTTGARIAGTNISAAGCGRATGVDTDGTFLYFNCNLNTIEQTTMAGALVHQFALPGTFGQAEGISLIENFNPPPPNGVPEPGSVALLGTVAALLGWKKMRNKVAPPSQA